MATQKSTTDNPTDKTQQSLKGYEFWEPRIGDWYADTPQKIKGLEAMKALRKKGKEH